MANISLDMFDDSFYDDSDLENPLLAPVNPINVPTTSDLVSIPTLTTPTTNPTKVFAVNGWTSEYIATLEIWKKKLLKTSRIYNNTIHKFVINQNKSLIMLLVTLIVCFLLGSASLALTVQNTYNLDDKIASYYNWAILGLTIGLLVLIGIITFVLYVIKVKFDQWLPYCLSMVKSVQNINHLYNVLDNHSTLPFDDRYNAVLFVRKYSMKMLTLSDTLTNITVSDYDEVSI